jgi:hypothetical protein
MAKVLVRSVLFDGTASFNMVGELGEDNFGRFVTSGEDRFYFPSNHLVHVRVIPDVPVTEVPAVDERAEEAAAPAEEVTPALKPGVMSKAMEMAIAISKSKTRNRKKK